MSTVDGHLFTRRDELDEEIRWPGLGELCVLSRRSPAKTTDNEDSVLVLRLGETQGVVAVADGVGGHPAGEDASAEALQCLLSEVEESASRGESVGDAVLSGLDRANQAVLALGAGSATTVAAITVNGSRIRAYHVGDSGIVAFGARGKVKLETIPHSPVGYGVEAGLIPADAAMAHAERHLVSNVVGDPDMHIGVSSPLELRPLDRVLLASDGLFDNIAVEDVVDGLRRGPMAAAARRLSAACHERMLGEGHADDLTIVVFRPGARE